MSHGTPLCTSCLTLHAGRVYDAGAQEGLVENEKGARAKGRCADKKQRRSFKTLHVAQFLVGAVEGQ